MLKRRKVPLGWHWTLSPDGRTDRARDGRPWDLQPVKLGVRDHDLASGPSRFTTLADQSSPGCPSGMARGSGCEVGEY